MLDETFKEWEQKMRQQGRREAEREARRETQKLLQQGRREAERETQKLLQQERREEQKMLLGMLRDRFGPVPQAVRQRVKDLSSSELRTIARRLITANSLQETGLLEATLEGRAGSQAETVISASAEQARPFIGVFGLAKQSSSHLAEPQSSAGKKKIPAGKFSCRVPGFLVAYLFPLSHSRFPRRVGVFPRLAEDSRVAYSFSSSRTCSLRRKG